MEPTLEKRIETLENKIDAIYVSVEKTRKYMFWTGVVTLVVIVLPLIGLMFVVPSFIDSYTSVLTGF